MRRGESKKREGGGEEKALLLKSSPGAASGINLAGRGRFLIKKGGTFRDFYQAYREFLGKPAQYSH